MIKLLPRGESWKARAMAKKLPKYKNFCCPDCGCTEYEEVEKSNGVMGPGGHTWIDHCFCARCRVMFKGAKKFCEENKKNKPQNGQATACPFI